MKDYPINAIDSEYIEWLKAIKQQIRSTKLRKECILLEMSVC